MRRVGHTGLSVAMAMAMLAFAPSPAVATGASIDIVIVGGPGAVSDAVMAELDSLTTGTVVRIAGPDRFSTAAEASKAAFDPGVPVVYIANAFDFPDALAAGPLASIQGGPLLLTLVDGVPAATRNELDRLDPGRIVVVGGAAVVANSVLNTLGQYTTGSVERVWGADRYATAAAISASHHAPGVEAVFIAVGDNFPDALAASTKAAIDGGPILLTFADTLPGATRDELERLEPERIFVVGGRAAVRDPVMNQLGDYTDGPVQRLAGPDRYGTAAAISEAAFDPSATRIYITTGTEFPDALAVGPIAGGAGFIALSGTGPGAGPVLLVDSVVPTAVKDEITRLGANAAPTPVPQAVAVDEDGSVPVTLSATDPDGDPIAYRVDTQPNHGTLSGNPPNLTYHPDDDFFGADSFTFTADDGFTESSPATVTITITGIPDPPVANNLTRSTTEDTPLSITLSGSDPDGDPLTYSIVIGAGHGVLTGTPPNVTYTPAANYSGPDQFSYIVNDGVNDSAGAIVTITVSSAPDAPTADNNFITTDEDVAVPVTLTGSDPENDPLTFQVTSNPDHGTLTGTAPNLTYTPDPGYNGLDSFTFVVNDGTSDSEDALVVLAIGEVNDPPTADDLEVAADEDTATAITLTGSDPEDDPLTFAVVDNPSHGSLTGTAPTLTYTPDPNYHGADSFTYLANDGTSDSFEATVSITIGQINDAPSADPKNVALDEDSAIGVTLTGSDPENDPLTFQVVDNPNHGTLTGTAPNLTYTPDPNYHGADSFRYRANDGASNSPNATVSITVNPINDAPSADDQALSTDEDVALPVTLSGSDLDNDPLTFQVVDNPDHGTLTGTAPNLTYTPDPNYHGADSFQYRANDSTTNSPNATVSITVNPINDPPSADDQNIAVDEDSAIGVTLTGSDPDNDPLSFQVVDNPDHGTLTGTAPNLTYTPDPNYHGADSFTYRANDTTTNSPNATVSITVNPINDPPTADDQAVQTDQGVTIAITLTGADLDNDPLTFEIVDGPAEGTLSGTAPAVSYRPRPQFTGVDTFTFRVNDGTVDSPVATVTITVSASGAAVLTGGGARAE